jgi:hypothetical protein
MAAMIPTATLPLWFSLLAISIACDAGATAYLKVAGDRLQGFGFICGQACSGSSPLLRPS